MTNPFPKPAAGSYRALIIQGLILMGENSLSDSFESKKINFAITATITGAVKLLPELKEVCLKALRTIPQTSSNEDTIGYYICELMNESVKVASSDGAFVYHLNDKASVEYVEQQLQSENFKNNGELYFKS